jgi:hypothetical protein
MTTSKLSLSKIDGIGIKPSIANYYKAKVG